jgi:superfamily II DNA or RNA helicase
MRSFFQSNIEVFYDDSPGVDDNIVPIDFLKNKREKSKIQLRDYQNQAYEACIKDLVTARSSLIVMATGLG